MQNTLLLQRTWTFRLYPKRVQREALHQVLDLHREFYNAALQERRDAWTRQRTSISYKHQADQIKEIRSLRADVAALNFSSLQQTLRRLDKAFQAFFRRVRQGETPGYPRFKGRHRFTSVTFRHGDGAVLCPEKGSGRWMLKLQGVGAVKVKLHRALPEGARITQAQIQKEGDRWYVAFSVEWQTKAPAPHPGPAVGLDAGITHLLAASDGRTWENPRFLKQALARLAQAQQVLSRRTRDSARSRKARRRVATLHAKVARQRKDQLHKISAEITRTYGRIALEDLSVQGLARSALAQSVLDASWGMLFAFLSYKAANAGGKTEGENPAGTSQDCSTCDQRVQKDLSVRTHACPHCNLVLDRDVNAARNVLKRVQRRLEEEDPAWTRPSISRLPA